MKGIFAAVVLKIVLENDCVSFAAPIQDSAEDEDLIVDDLDAVEQFLKAGFSLPVFFVLQAA